MARFHYDACDKSGKKCQGTIDAENIRLARQQLRDKQLIILTITPIKERWFKQLLDHKKRIKITHHDLVLFTRQLATLNAAAMPLEEALYVVAQQTEKKRVSELVMQIRHRVTEGFSLAQTLKQYPNVFNTLFCAMVEAGEATGKLATILTQLADYVEQQQKLKSKLIHAVTYPIILITVAISVVSILLTVVVPKVIQQFIHLKQELPVITRLLITVSDFLQQWGGGIALGILVAIVLFQRWLKQSDHRLQWHKTLLRIPVIGPLHLAVNTAHYAKTLSILSLSAVPLLDSMRISASVGSCEHARRQLTMAMDHVREGSSLGHALERTQLFSPMMKHMIASGERSGELGAMLNRAAEMQHDNLNQKISMALSLFEPLLVTSMAAIVLFIILAIMQPILQLNTLI